MSSFTECRRHKSEYFLKTFGILQVLLQDITFNRHWSRLQMLTAQSSSSSFHY